MDWNDLQDERHNWVPASLQSAFYLFMKKNTGHKISQNANLEEKILSDRMRAWNQFHLYFEWLGLWINETDQEAIGNYCRKNWYFVKSITLTDFGIKVIPILLWERNLQFWNTSLRWENGEVNSIPGSPLEEFIFHLPEEIEEYFIQQMDDAYVQPFLQPFKKLFPVGDLQKSLPRNTRQFIDGLDTFKVTFMSGVW